MNPAKAAERELLSPRDLEELCARQSMLRLRLVLLAVVPIVLAHVVYFGLTAVPGLPAERLWWRQLVALAQTVLFALLVLLVGLSWRAWRRPDEPLGWRRALPTAAAALFLVATAAMASIDQLVSTAITPFITATMGVALGLRLTTRATVAVYLAGYAALALGLPRFQAQHDALVSALVNGVTTSGVGLAISLAFTRSLAQGERARRTIEHQRTELVRLRGLLRVCSYCKKIFNEKSQWEPLDAFVARATASEITHGMCEGCFEAQATEPL